MSEFPQPDLDADLETTDERTPPSVGRWVLFLVALMLAVVAVGWGLSRADGTAPNGEMTVSWLADSIQVREDVGVIEITVILSAPAPQDLVITFETRGTASVLDDYNLLIASLGIPAGEDHAILPILIIDDGPSGEARESAMIAIEGITAGQVGSLDTFTLVIEEPRTATAAPTVPTTTSTTSDRGTTTTTTATAPLGSAISPLGVTKLTEGSTKLAGSVEAGSFSAEPDAIVLLMVASATSTAPTATPVPSSDQLQWELVETSTRNEGPRRISMFRAATGEGGAFALSMDFGDAQEVIDWMVVQVENAPTEQNGAAAIVQTGAAAAVDFEFHAAVELAPLQASDSITVGAFFTGANRAEGLSGFETIGLVGPQKRLLLGIVGEDPFVGTADWPTRAHWIGVAVEITNRR